MPTYLKNEELNSTFNVIGSIEADPALTGLPPMASNSKAVVYAGSLTKTQRVATPTYSIYLPLIQAIYAMDDSLTTIDESEVSITDSFGEGYEVFESSFTASGIDADGDLIVCGCYALGENTEPIPYLFGGFVWKGGEFTVNYTGDGTEELVGICTSAFATQYNIDDLTTFYVGITDGGDTADGLYTINLTDGTFTFKTVSISIQDFLLCNDEVTFAFNYDDAKLFDANTDEEYIFDEVTLVTPVIVSDGEYYYLIPDVDEPPENIVRFKLGEELYDSLIFSDTYSPFGISSFGLAASPYSE